MSDERDKAEADHSPAGADEALGSSAPTSDKASGDDASDENTSKPEAETAPLSTDTNEKPSVDEKASSDGPRLGVPPTVVSTAKPSYVFLAVVAVMALALDLGTKSWAVDHLGGAHSHRMVIVENFFHLDMAQNKGGAWGIFGDQPDYIRLPFFFLISAVAVVFVVSLYKRLEPRQVALKWALPLLLGGAAGNLIDRIRHQYVVDFLDVFITRDGHQTHWPTFNVADVWIVVGVALMAIDMFTPRKPVPEKPREEAEAEA